MSRARCEPTRLTLYGPDGAVIAENLRFDPDRGRTDPGVIAEDVPLVGDRFVVGEMELPTSDGGTATLRLPGYRLADGSWGWACCAEHLDELPTRSAVFETMLSRYLRDRDELPELYQSLDAIPFDLLMTYKSGAVAALDPEALWDSDDDYALRGLTSVLTSHYWVRLNPGWWEGRERLGLLNFFELGSSVAVWAGPLDDGAQATTALSARALGAILVRAGYIRMSASRKANLTPVFVRNIAWILDVRNDRVGDLAEVFKAMATDPDDTYTPVQHETTPTNPLGAMVAHGVIPERYHHLIPAKYRKYDPGAASDSVCVRCRYVNRDGSPVCAHCGTLTGDTPGVPEDQRIDWADPGGRMVDAHDPAGCPVCGDGDGTAHPGAGAVCPSGVEGFLGTLDSRIGEVLSGGDPGDASLWWLVDNLVAAGRGPLVDAWDTVGWSGPPVDNPDWIDPRSWALGRISERLPARGWPAMTAVALRRPHAVGAPLGDLVGRILTAQWLTTPRVAFEDSEVGSVRWWATDMPMGVSRWVIHRVAGGDHRWVIDRFRETLGGDPDRWGDDPAFHFWLTVMCDHVTTTEADPAAREQVGDLVRQFAHLTVSADPRALRRSVHTEHPPGSCGDVPYETHMTNTLLRGYLTQGWASEPLLADPGGAAAHGRIFNCSTCRSLAYWWLTSAFVRTVDDDTEPVDPGVYRPSEGAWVDTLFDQLTGTDTGVPPVASPAEAVTGELGACLVPDFSQMWRDLT